MHKKVQPINQTSIAKTHQKKFKTITILHELIQLPQQLQIQTVQQTYHTSTTQKPHKKTCNIITQSSQTTSVYNNHSQIKANQFNTSRTHSSHKAIECVTNQHHKHTKTKKKHKHKSSNIVKTSSQIASAYKQPWQNISQTAHQIKHTFTTQNQTRTIQIQQAYSYKSHSQIKAKMCSISITHASHKITKPMQISLQHAHSHVTIIAKS